MALPKRLRAAACHTSPVFLSAQETTKKCISLISRASKLGSADLVVFPESFIPAFPYWSSLRAPTENHSFFSTLAAQSLYIDGPEIHAIRNAARSSNVIVSVGISEKVRYSSATLFNSNLIIGKDGEILVHHRKLSPTFFEKLTWSAGDGYGLRVAETAKGKIGALICGENTNPLARYALIAQGEQVHISTWPAVWPTRVLGSSFSSSSSPSSSSSSSSEVSSSSSTPSSSSQHLPDSSSANPTDRSHPSTNTTTSPISPPPLPSSSQEGKNYDNATANLTRAAAHSFEAKAFSILCSSLLPTSTISLLSSSTISSNPDLVRRTLETSPRGATMFLDPTGAVMPGFTICEATGKEEERKFLRDEEGILYADLDLGLCVEGKQYHDVVGGYQRFDVFDLRVDRRRRKGPVTFVGEGDEE